jgi:hypothetical protein
LHPNDQIEIERLGGLAGMGLAGSRIRSVARTTVSALSAAEHQALLAAVHTPAAAHPLTRDGFRYRITRHGVEGTQVVEVAEGQLPASLQARVQDELA